MVKKKDIFRYILKIYSTFLLRLIDIEIINYILDFEFVVKTTSKNIIKNKSAL